MTPINSLTTVFFLILSLFLSSVSSLSIPVFNGTLLTPLSSLISLLGYQILDLTSLTWQKFNLEAEPWTISPAATSPSTITTNCSSYPILGGYNILSSNSYFSRTYSDLTSHNILYYQIRYFIIDDWQSSDGIIVSFDTDATTKISPYSGLSLSSTNLCGQTAYDDLAWYTRLGTIAHSSGSLTIEILSSISNSPSTASFGVRDISIVLGNTTDTPSDSYCSRAFDDRVYGTWGECECVRGKYSFFSLLGILSCIDCDDSCADCFGSGPENCYVCNDGYSYTTSGCTKCDSSCATCSGIASNQCITCASGLWLQGNNTCTSTCNLPSDFSQEVDDFKLCQTDCSSGEKKLWDGTCSSTCSFPLVEKVVDDNKLCLKPCDNDEDYVYSDGSCETTCDDYYIEKVIDSVLVCVDPCDFESGEFLSWNGDCITTCSSPSYQRTENGITFCDVCQPDYYQYPDGSCLEACDSPLEFKTINGSVFCYSDCNPSEYIYPDGSCDSTCDDYYIEKVIDSVLICADPCDFNSGEFLSWNGDCVTSCSSPNYQRTENGITFCDVCQPDYYQYPDGSCLETCNSPLKSKTINGSVFCYSDCDSSKYIYPDDSCDSACDSYYLETTINSILVCQYPCDFDAGEFLSWDGGCTMTCSLPNYQRTKNNIVFCDACQPNSYNYPNGTCLDTCDSPLKSKTINGSIFCYSDCDSSSEYLFLDGSCSSTCDSPYIQRIESIANFCDYPCPTGFYLYLNNNTCLTSCNSPYIKSSQNDVDTCKRPCTDLASSPYLYQNGSCLSTCPSSSYNILIFDTILLCQSKQTTTDEESSSSTTEEDQTQSVISAVDALKTGSQVASVGAKIASVLYSSNPKALSLASLDQMLMYIRYLSIGYPPKLVYMFHQEGSASISISFSPDLSESTSEKFEKYSLPENFEEYELDSSFFLNYWGNLSSLLIVLAAIVLLSFITRYTKKFQNAHLVLYRVKLIAKWDFFLMIFYSSCDGIAFFSSLQFRTMHFNSITSSLSSIVCIIMVLLTPFILFRTLYIIRDINKIKSQSIFPSAKKREALKKWEGYELLHKGYKRDSFLQQGFIFFFVLRTVTFNFIIGYLFEYPLAQAILITSLSIIMLLYLGIKRPFEQTRDLVQLMISEGLLFIVNLSILILGILDYHNVEATKDRERIGDLIIVIKVTFVMLSIIFLFIDLLLGIYEIYKGFRKSKDRGVKAILQLFLAFFVPDGMVIEEKELKRTRTFARFLTRMHTRHILEPKPTIVVSDADQILPSSPKPNPIISLENHNESLLNHNNPYDSSVRSSNALQKDAFTPSTSTFLPLSSYRKQRSSLRFDETTARFSPSTSRSRPATTSLSERTNIIMISTERKSRNQGIIFDNNFMEDEKTEENNAGLPVIQSEVTQQDADRENLGFQRGRNGKAFPIRFHEIVKKPIEFLPGNMMSAFKSRADEYLSQQRQSIASKGSNEEVIGDFFKEIEGDENHKEFSLSEGDYRDSPEQEDRKDIMKEEKGCSTVLFEDVHEPRQKEGDDENQKSESSVKESKSFDEQEKKEKNLADF